MISKLVIQIVMFGSFEDTQMNADQLHDLIRAANVPLKSIAFVYEGRMQWVGDPKLVDGDPGKFDEEFQGTFLYRSDGASLYDVYKSNPSRGGGVVRKKSSMLRGRWEATMDILDSSHAIGANDIKVTEIEANPISSLNYNPLDAPNDLFATWSLEKVYSLADREIWVDGWERLGDRNCMRVRARVIDDENDKDLNIRTFWVDLERNSQVLKIEHYRHDQLLARIDEVILAELPLGGGHLLWQPVHCRHQWFTLGDQISKAPLYERTTSLVNGSIRGNLDLPDSLFTVTRNSAWPSQDELEGVRNATKSGALFLKFQSQPAISPYATDPVSVRRRIEQNLVEADRQSKQIEASSPARWSWNGTTLTQMVFALLGLALLASVVVWKRREA